MAAIASLSHGLPPAETKRDYDPPFSMSRKGLQSFVDEISEGIAELGLQVTVTRDETKEGRLWICLVSQSGLYIRTHTKAMSYR